MATNCVHVACFTLLCGNAHNEARTEFNTAVLCRNVLQWQTILLPVSGGGGGGNTEITCICLVKAFSSLSLISCISHFNNIYCASSCRQGHCQCYPIVHTCLLQKIHFSVANVYSCSTINPKQPKNLGETFPQLTKICFRFL